ncbi:Mitochondrial fission protein [Xylographa carneopallida]|nr:Mitochondrial fission protein [Xylographa carneopallida]
MEGDSVLGTALTTRHIEAFGRKVTTTASHLIGPLSDATNSSHYQHAMSELHKELRRPGIQQRVFSYAQSSPTELVRFKLSTSEIQHRALTFIPDELLKSIPENDNVYSLFQGFQATLPELDESEHRKSHRRHDSRGRKLLADVPEEAEGPPSMTKLKKERNKLNHRLEMMGVRKNMCSSEIREIDNKISNLNSMRKIVLDRLSRLEDDELKIEHELLELDNRVEDLQEELDDAATLGHVATPPAERDTVSETMTSETQVEAENFMSASIYEKIPSPKAKRHKLPRRKSLPIRHEHFEPGTSIKEIPAHNDMITAIDFDAPFGTMVTAALDDTVRVWDLNQGRCLGLLEGHRASVRCLQVEDNIVATGSIDASIRLWDLSKTDYPQQDSHNDNSTEEEDDDELVFANPTVQTQALPPSSSMEDCPIFSLEAHIGEVTALHFRGDTLVSGSADKTLRQWDLVKGRCIQTLDVLWAAAQASTTSNLNDGQWRTTGRLPDASADFVGALQCFDAALACGTADGMVRLWDLRSGQVSRSLVGHTGPVTSLQFDDVHLVTGSLDRSIRIWDLRTGSIHDAFAFDNPITSMMFDTRRIVAAAGEDVAKVYDKTDGRHWDCGAGASAIEGGPRASIVERVRIKDGFLVEGRRDGVVGRWTAIGGEGMRTEVNNLTRAIPQTCHSTCYHSGVMTSSGSHQREEEMIKKAGTRTGRPSTRVKQRGMRKSTIALFALATTIPAASTQACIPLSGSTQCPAFNASSISTDSSLVRLYPFLAFVSTREQFDQQLGQYVTSDYVQLRYQQLLGCNNVTLTNTTNYYARYTTSVICNSIVQNSIQPCKLSSTDSPPLCADSCAQQAISEEEITTNRQLCGTTDQNFLTQIRADFTNCALPPASLSGSCISGEHNEPENCGFSTNLQGLCLYCGASSPNATDSCCVGSNVTSRCQGVVLPSPSTMPPLFPSSTSSSLPSATNGTLSTDNGLGHSGLSGGQIAGIAIGSILGALLLLGLLILCCICVRRRRTRSPRGSIFNQPSPKRAADPPMAYAPRDSIQQAPGRVARMAALEGNSSDEPNHGNPVIAAEQRRRYGDTSDSDPYGDSAESRRDPLRPITSKRNGSLSSNSVFGGGMTDLNDETSPHSGSGGQFSSPEGVNSGQSEQLPSFKDYYSQDEIHPNDRVAALWAYQPRAGDEFELERGDMLKVVGIWDDGWATGVRIADRAEDYDGKHKIQRDSGVSNGSGRRDQSPPPIGEIKAFPLVCVCLPEHWRNTIEGEGSPEDPGLGGY